MYLIYSGPKKFHRDTRRNHYCLHLLSSLPHISIHGGVCLLQKAPVQEMRKKSQTAHRQVSPFP